MSRAPGHRRRSGGAWHIVRNLWIQVAHTSGAKIYALCVGLVVLALTARYLGPDGRGIVVAATTWATMFAALGGLSLGQVALYHGAGRPPSEWLRPTMRTMLRYLAAVSVAGWVLAAGAYVGSDGAWFPNTSAVALGIALLGFPLLIWTEYATSLLMATDSLGVANAAQVIGSSINGILVVVLLLGTTLGVLAPLLAVVIAGALTAAYTIGKLNGRASASSGAESGGGRSLLAAGLRLHANALGTFLFAQASLLVVNHYRPPAETAFYGLAMQLIAVANIIPTSMGMVAYTLVGKHGPDGAWPQQRRLLAQGLVAAMGIIGIGYLLAPFGVRIVAGSDFLPAVTPFRAVLLALVGMTFSAIMASQWIGRGFFSHAAAITITLGLINIVATLYLVPRHGMMGAAGALVFTYTLSVLINGGLMIWIGRQARPTRTMTNAS